jgi:hypothetical protein
MFIDRERSNEEIVLLHVADFLAQAVGGHLFPVYFHIALDVELAGYAKVEYVEKTRFSRSASKRPFSLYQLLVSVRALRTYLDPRMAID